VAKEHDFGFATRMRSEQSDEPSTEQFERSIIPAKLPHRCACARPDEIFGRHWGFLSAKVKNFLPTKILGAIYDIWKS
jgi:hypothetical protein